MSDLCDSLKSTILPDFTELIAFIYLGYEILVIIKLINYRLILCHKCTKHSIHSYPGIVVMLLSDSFQFEGGQNVQCPPNWCLTLRHLVSSQCIMIRSLLPCVTSKVHHSYWAPQHIFCNLHVALVSDSSSSL